MSAISPFQFTAPLLTESHFIVHREKRDKDVVNIHLHRNIVKSEENPTQALVEVKVQLNKNEDKELEDACFVAEVTMQSAFTWPENLAEQQVNNLLEINAPALLISYIRPIIVQLTSASPIPVYNLPFLNLNELLAEPETK